jgi:hypothetical protein
MSSNSTSTAPLRTFSDPSTLRQRGRIPYITTTAETATLCSPILPDISSNDSKAVVVGVTVDVGLVKVVTLVTTIGTDEVVVVRRVVLELVMLLLLAEDVLEMAVDVEAPLPTL